MRWSTPTRPGSSKLWQSKASFDGFGMVDARSLMQAAGTRIQDTGKNRHFLHDGIVRLTASAIEEARLDAELLLAAVQGITLARLLAHLDETPTAVAARWFETLLDRRARHE